MNWIEELYTITAKDEFSQNGEAVILDHIFDNVSQGSRFLVDIGGGNGEYLSNTKVLGDKGWIRLIIDRLNGFNATVENIVEEIRTRYIFTMTLISIDIDGNDYWILDKILSTGIKPNVIVAEFNPRYADSRTIAYNPDHIWAGDSYYGFTFEAGKKLAEKHGYKVIFQLADMNMFMVRADLIEGLTFPEVTYKQNDFFKLSAREDWVYL